MQNLYSVNHYGKCSINVSEVGYLLNDVQTVHVPSRAKALKGYRCRGVSLTRSVALITLINVPVCFNLPIYEMEQ